MVVPSYPWFYFPQIQLPMANCGLRTVNGKFVEHNLETKFPAILEEWWNFTLSLLVPLGMWIISAQLIPTFSHLVAAWIIRGASLVAQLVKNPPAMQETQVQSLGWEDPCKREWLPIPVFLLEEFWGQRSLAGLQTMGSQRIRHDWVTFILTLSFKFKGNTSRLLFGISVLPASLLLCFAAIIK